MSDPVAQNAYPAAPQATTYIVHTPNVMVSNEVHPATAYKGVFKGIGIAEVVLGALCVILGVVVLILIAPNFYAGAGVWGGGWYIVSGSLGIASGSQPNSCNVTAGLVISIFAAIIAFAALIIDGLAASAWAIVGVPALTGLHGALAAFSFVEFVVAIVHSAFCCKTGCGNRTVQGQVITTTAVNVPPPQMQQPPGYNAQKM